MQRWIKNGDVLCKWPNKPTGLIEIIGGSYLSISPHISYARILKGLSRNGLAIHALIYTPNFDHQSQANKAWQEFRFCKRILRERIGYLPPVTRLGHSLGCKLHLLAPDGGRNSEGLVCLSFNNFSADRSIPMLSELSPKFGLNSEFIPNPTDTFKIIEKHYLKKKNLLITFKKDYLDQSDELLRCLRNRASDESEIIKLKGNHLTPASTGFRKGVLGDWADDKDKSKTLDKLIGMISNWSTY